MPKKVKPEELFKRYRAKVSFIDDYLGEYDKQLVALQNQLYAMIIADYVPKLATKDGFIILNEKNARVLAELDRVFDTFKKKFAEDVFKGTAEAMLKLTGLTSSYYRAFNLNAKTIANIEDKLSKMRLTIGIDTKGKVIQGSFIDKLASTPQTKDLLSDYVRKGIEGQTGYKDFVKGFKELIKGNKDVDGSMERYAKQYIHDSMYTHGQAVDNFFADELGLNRFYYAGDQIKTTRPFCSERYGQEFTREEGEEWNSLDWAGKIPGVDFFSQRGGYNCRHNLMWLPDEVDEQEMQAADPTEPEVKQTETAYKEAKTLKEAQERVNNIVPNANIKGLNISESNAVLEALEIDVKKSGKSLDGIKTYKKNDYVSAQLRTKINRDTWKPEQILEINLNNIKRNPAGVTNYGKKIKELDEKIDNYKNNYLNNPKYDQKVVNKNMSIYTRERNRMKKYIDNGVESLPFTVSDKAKDVYSKIKTDVFHELGHSKEGAYRKKYKKWFDIDDKYIKNHISEYGMTNKSEAFAEYYAEYMMYGAKNIPDDILKIIKVVENAEL